MGTLKRLSFEYYLLQGMGKNFMKNDVKSRRSFPTPMKVFLHPVIVFGQKFRLKSVFTYFAENILNYVGLFESYELMAY